MSVLDLDFYKLTMLQFIWKHYADVPVTFRLHSRRQDLDEIVAIEEVSEDLFDFYYNDGLTYDERWYLDGLGIFERAFLDDLQNMLLTRLARPRVKPNGTIEVSGSWFSTSLWETVVLSMVTEEYSRVSNLEPDFVSRFADVYKIGKSGAKWVDFGTRRRYSRANHESVLDDLAYLEPDKRYGFMGTSNVDLARRLGLTPVGTYAHELEMVLRATRPNYLGEYRTTRDVLTKWGEMYPRELRIALTDTYTTENFLLSHGKFLLDNDWRGVRLDSGNPLEVGITVANWLASTGTVWDVVFSDGLDAQAIVNLQGYFGDNEPLINPLYGWGTGFTNPKSNLSLVMKAVESSGVKTYKITDDEEKSIR